MSDDPQEVTKSAVISSEVKSLVKDLEDVISKF